MNVVWAYRSYYCPRLRRHRREQITLRMRLYYFPVSSRELLPSQLTENQFWVPPVHQTHQVRLGRPRLEILPLQVLPRTPRICQGACHGDVVHFLLPSSPAARDPR